MDDAQDRDDAQAKDAPQESKSATKPVTKPVTVHAFEVANYSLGALDFATPAVHEATLLKMESYSLGPLFFSTPIWRWGEYILHWHDAGDDSGGRPPDIPADEAPGLIAATRDFLAKRRITDLKRMTKPDREGLYTFVRKLAENKGIRATDRTLREQIIGPALPEK
jgi:hypothetical protein